MIVTLLALLATVDRTAAPCPGFTTPEAGQCALDRSGRARRRLDEYLDAARRRQIEQRNAAVLLGIDASQRGFEAYRHIECAAVHESWKDGSIRTVAEAMCDAALTDDRTRTIWRNWLTFADRTPPLLPEPEPTP